jgi:uncharacterized protein YuzE
MADIRYDEEADAIYIRLHTGDYAYGEELDPERRIDYEASGRAIGIELLCVSTGVDLRNLPEADVVSELLGKHRIKILAS